MSRHRKPRVVEPERKQGVIRFEVPEESLEATHPARLLWEMFGRLDLSAFLRGAKAVEDHVGRPTLSPRMMLTLWAYGISRGIGSAREIERLTRSDEGFRWVVGDVSVSHHSLSSFRVGHPQALDKLLTDVLGVLVHKRVLSLELVALDGMRVRAHASAPSFRAAGSLDDCREQAALHLKAVLAQADDPELTAAQHAARMAGARDVLRRVDEAIDTVQALQNERKPSAPPARASTTDAEARVMKMADGGFRPAFNVQAATAGSELGGPRTIVAVGVTNVGSDMGAIVPLLEQIERRIGALPATILADANHANHDALRYAAQRGVESLVAVPSSSQTPTTHRADRDPIVQQWRARMTTQDAKYRYRARAGLCELTNSHLRRHGLLQFLVRGVVKTTCVALLAAIASNLLNHAATLLG